MARSEIEQDIGGLPDQEFPCSKKRRRERRRALARLHDPGHRGHTASAARDIDIVGAGILQREPDVFATALNARPVIEFIAHGESFDRSLTRNTADRIRSYLSSWRGPKRRSKSTLGHSGAMRSIEPGSSSRGAPSREPVGRDRLVLPRNDLHQFAAKQYSSPSPPVLLRSPCEQPPSGPREGCELFQDFDASS